MQQAVRGREIQNSSELVDNKKAGGYAPALLQWAVGLYKDFMPSSIVTAGSM